MTMKPFEIQSPSLSINGVLIDTSAQGKLVIPGVTRAGTSVAIEVDDTDDQTVTWSAIPTVIDGFTYQVYITGNETAPVDWIAATYQVDELDDDGFIDDISVVNGGAGYSGQVNAFAKGPMYAAPEGTPLNSASMTDWVLIPFKVRCGAGEIESEFNGDGADLGDFSIDGSTLSSESEVGIEIGSNYNVRIVADKSDNNITWEFDGGSRELKLPTGGDIVNSDGVSVLGSGGGSTNTGYITFSGGTLSNPEDNTVRLQTQDINQTASYNFTPGAGYSTVVWNGTDVVFNDPTQTIYDAIWALTDVSVVELLINGSWQTVTYNGSSTPGMPAAPTLSVAETAVDGPLTVDEVQFTINQGTTSYAEIDGADFRVDVQDDIRMYANDTFLLSNKGIGESINIETNDGEHTWRLKADGNLQLPYGGSIVDSDGNSLLGSSGTGWGPGNNIIQNADTELRIVVQDPNEDSYRIDLAIEDDMGGVKSRIEMDYEEVQIETGGGQNQWRFESNGEFRIPGNINTFDTDINIIAMNAGGTGNITIKAVSNMNDIHYSQVQLTQNGVTITTDMDNTVGGKSFEFRDTGVLVLPAGGDIQDSTGTSLLGGSSYGDSNVGVYLTTNGYANGLSTVATSGSYDDLTDKPTIPSLGALTVNVNTIQGGVAGQVGTSYTKTVDANGNDYTTSGGSLGFLNFGADGEVEQVKAGWTVTFASGETRTVSQDAWQPIGTYWNISFNNSYTWTAGDIMPITFSSPDYVAGSDPVVVLSADTKNWTFDDAGKLTLPAGGDIVDSTGTSVLGSGSGGGAGYEIKSADFNAEVGKTYWLNTGSSAKTVTLPASPSAGDWVKIYDGSMSWQTYNLTVNGNGNNVRTFNMPTGWNSPSSTGTISQSLVSPAGPFAVAFVWDGTSWFSAI